MKKPLKIETFLNRRSMHPTRQKSFLRMPTLIEN